MLLKDGMLGEPNVQCMACFKHTNVFKTGDEQLSSNVFADLSLVEKMTLNT